MAADIHLTIGSNTASTATVIAYVGASVGLIGGAVALFNAWKAVRWKRAELANSLLRDFNSNEELVFAGRCLDWNGGRLVLPKNLQGYLEDGSSTIQHDKRVLAKALRYDLKIAEMDEDPRIQIYRIVIDSFLSWLCLVSSALERNLFHVSDIEEVGYWAAKVQSERILYGFIVAFGYKEGIENLIRRYRKKKSPYRDWFFPSYFTRESDVPPVTSSEQERQIHKEYAGEPGEGSNP